VEGSGPLKTLTGLQEDIWRSCTIVNYVRDTLEGSGPPRTLAGLQEDIWRFCTIVKYV
jgi:hypothetical protein